MSKLTAEEFKQKLLELGFSLDFFKQKISEGSYKLDEDERQLIKENKECFYALCNSIWVDEQLKKWKRVLEVFR